MQKGLYHRAGELREKVRRAIQSYAERAEAFPVPRQLHLHDSFKKGRDLPSACAHLESKLASEMPKKHNESSCRSWIPRKTVTSSPSPHAPNRSLRESVWVCAGCIILEGLNGGTSLDCASPCQPLKPCRPPALYLEREWHREM